MSDSHPSTLPSLSSAAMTVRVDPEYGARVVSLVDHRRGREWLVQGPPSRTTGETAVYDRAEKALGIGARRDSGGA